MNVIVFKVKGNKLTRVGGCDPVSGEKNQTKFRFVFDDEDWKGITSATVTQFFDVRYGQNIPFENDKGFGGSLEVSIHDELRGLSGILWVGLTGYNPKTGATLDCVLTAVPVGQGTVVTEIIGTKLYQEILEFYLSTKAAVAELEDKFGKEYWKRIVTVDPITTYNELFETVGLVNSKGSIAQVAVDITTGTEGTIKGVCLAYGKEFTNGDTVYLINTSTGDFWKIDRYIKINDDGVDTVSFKPTRLMVTEDKLEDGAITPEKLDRTYWEKKVIIDDYFKDVESLFNAVRCVNDGGSLYVVNINAPVNIGTESVELITLKGICYVFGVAFTNGDTIYLSNMTDGSFWKIDRYNEGTELVPVYRIESHLLDVIRDGSVTPEKLDRKYMERCVTEFGEKITSLAELVEKVGYINRGGQLGFVSLDIQESEKEIITPDGYINGEFIAVGSVKTGDVYLVELGGVSFWGVGISNDGSYIATRNKALEYRIEYLERSALRNYDVEDKGAEITLTIEQVYALDKMFELAAYKDDAVAEVYKGFISAFGLDKYRAMRVLDGSELFEGRLSSYWNPATNTDHDWKQVNASLDENGNALADGIPYAYQNRADGSSDRTCYPKFDIPAEGGYKYQVYFEANEGVQLALDFYNQNVLDAYEKNENWNTDDYETNFGWQDSMGKEWEPSKEINGSPVKAMRLNFSQKNAGIKKVIIYRKKVTEDADS